MNTLTIAILNWNGLEYLEECLASVPLDLQAEKLLIDNASTDGSWKLADKYGFRVIHADNKYQFITGINTALREAKGEYILFSQGDVRFGDQAVKELLANSNIYPHSILQPVFVRPGFGIDNAGMSLVWPGYGFGHRKVLHSYTYETDVATSITFMTTRSVVELVGLYDERYAPAYMEDVDWALRSKKCGVRHLVCPYAYVMHRHNESFSKHYDRFGLSEICRRNRKYLIEKNYSGLDRMIRSSVLAMMDITKKSFDIVTQGRIFANNGH